MEVSVKSASFTETVSSVLSKMKALGVPSCRLKIAMDFEFKDIGIAHSVGFFSEYEYCQAREYIEAVINRYLASKSVNGLNELNRKQVKELKDTVKKINAEMLVYINQSLMKTAVDVIIADKSCVDTTKLCLLNIDNQYAIFPIKINTDNSCMVLKSFYKGSEKILGYNLASSELPNEYYDAVSKCGRVIENTNKHTEKEITKYF